MKIKFKKFTLVIYIDKTYSTSMGIRKRFSMKFIKRQGFTCEGYWTGQRIVYIKRLREAHREKYGKPSSLRETKHFLDDVFSIFN